MKRSATPCYDLSPNSIRLNCISPAGIALASNLGGMTSPISSPQNIFAIEQMSRAGGAPSWLTWFAVSLPVSVIAAVIVWGVLLLVYPSNVKAVQQLPELKVVPSALDISNFESGGILSHVFLIPSVAAVKQLSIHENTDPLLG